MKEAVFSSIPRILAFRCALCTSSPQSPSLAAPHSRDPLLPHRVERGAVGRVIDRPGSTVTTFGHGCRVHPQADSTAPSRQHLAQMLHPQPEQPDHPLRRTAPAPARQCVRGRWLPPRTTRRRPLWYCIVNPRADRHRPRRDRRQCPLLPRPRICVRQMRLVPAPWLERRDTTTRCQSKSCQLSKVRDCPTTASGCLDNHL